MLTVVTGGSKGIGRAIIAKFASQGSDIATCGRGEAELRQLKKDIEAQYAVRLHHLAVDLSDQKEAETFVAYVRTIGRPVDLLVNNTGIFVPGQVHTEEDGILETMINTNLYSAYHVTRGLIGDMIQRRQGHIFNICSTASITPYTNGGSYCISKYAMYGFSKVLREEMKPHGVRVTSVLPGATLTASWEGADIPPDRFMKPEDVAEAIWAAWSLSPQTVLEELVLRPQLGDIG
jgi:short-subunit dehydrogenase